MNYKAKVALIYTGVAVLSAGILAASLFLNTRPKVPEASGLIQHAGSDRPDMWFPIEGDLELVNQVGEKVKLSQLRGKVWIAAEFFAVCPMCATRNGSDMREFYQKYGSNPDFQIVCISVDPKEDNQERLKDYAKALGADAKNWWFLTGDEKETHTFLTEKMKFLKIMERTDPIERQSLGRYSHDLGLVVVNRDMQVIGKRDLAWAKEQNHDIYEEFKGYLHERIESALKEPKGAAPATTSNDETK